MNVKNLDHFDSPIFKGLTPDAPVSGGMLEAINCYSIDGGSALRSKCLGRFIEAEDNVVSDVDIAWYGAQFFEYVCADGSKFIVADHGNAVYIAENTTTESGEITIGAWTEVIAPAGSAVQSSYAIFRNVCVRVNGTSDNQYFDQNADLSSIALTPPAAAPSVANTTGGSINAGTYAVYYCYVKNNGDANECKSNPSPMATVTVSDNAINVTTVASTEADVDAIIIFRSLYDSSTIVEAVTISNASTTTKLTLGDDGIRGNDLMTFNWVKPPKSEFVTVGANRLWLIDVDTCRAYFTEENSVEQFGAYNYTTDFDREDGDEITGVAAVKNYIFVFKRNKVFAISLTTGFPVTVIDKNDGCINGRTIAIDEENNAIIFLSATGVKIITITSKGDLTENKIWRTMVINDIVGMTDPMQCFGSYSRASGCYHLYYSSGDLPSEAKHYVCSLKYSGINTGAWFMFDEKYSLDPDDEGYKFYSFGILTDNAGLPFLCSPANRTTSGDTVQFLQLEDLAPLTPMTGWVTIETSISDISEHRHIHVGSTYPDLSVDDAIYCGMTRTDGESGWPSIYRVGKYSATKIFNMSLHKMALSIGDNEECNGSRVYYNHGNYFYVSCNLYDTALETNRTLIAKVHRSTLAVSTAASIPSGAEVWYEITYTLDVDYFESLGYTWNSTTRELLSSDGSYGCVVPEIFSDTEEISYYCAIFLGFFPTSTSWACCVWSYGG